MLADASSTAILHSPNYPKKYDINTYCTYKVQNGMFPAKSILMEFEDFKTEDGYDKLYVSF